MNDCYVWTEQLVKVYDVKHSWCTESLSDAFQNRLIVNCECMRMYHAAYRREEPWRFEYESHFHLHDMFDNVRLAKNIGDGVPRR